jgi:hypothetical protein
MSDNSRILAVSQVLQRFLSSTRNEILWLGFRHCERSEAIHGREAFPGLLRLRLAMTAYGRDVRIIEPESA